mgnify:CR=1 FL=1
MPPQSLSQLHLAVDKDSFAQAIELFRVYDYTDINPEIASSLLGVFTIVNIKDGIMFIWADVENLEVWFCNHKQA